jgi:tetratricopeptide (TPR) repeat protein
MAELRVHPREIGSAELSVLVPGLAAIDLNQDRRPLRLAASLARSATVHAAATYLAETVEWDFLLARYALLADVWRDLVARPGEAETDCYDGAGGGACRLLDVMLGRLLELAGPDATVFLVAAAGWRTAGLTAADAADDAFTAFDKGMLVACGPGIKPDALFHRADGADVAPTILACFGRSVPADGCVVEALFAGGAPQLTSTRPLPAAVSAAGSDPATHLLALGYADKLNSAQLQAIAETETQAHRNLADSYLSLQEWREAIVVLKALLQRVPGDSLANLKLGRVLLLLGDIAAAQSCAEAAHAAAPDLAWTELLMGSVHAAAGNEAAAESHLLRARALGGASPAGNLRLGWAAVMLHRWAEAESSFKAVIGADRTIAEAHAGLGISLQGQNRMGEAEAALRHAIALVYGNSLAHFHLGQVLASRGAFHDAASALRIALAQNPALNEAKDMLSRVEEAVAIRR